MKTTDRVIQKIAMPIIAVAGVLLILTAVLSAKGTNNENNAYIRVINCIVSYNASTRTQADIEKCYTKVEKEMGIKLQRYDNADGQ